MFKDEPTEYLTSFKRFLLEQSKKGDRAVAELLAEIERELLKRAEFCPSR